MSDTDLLRRCIAGEKPAWEDLVRRHAPVMYAMALRVLPAGDAGAAQAEDVVQTVFLKLWDDDRRRLRSFGGRSRLSTWLAAVARREALDRLRRTKRERERDAAAGREALERVRAGLREVRRNGVASPQEASLAARERAGGLAAALERLPARDRLLVRLVYEDGCSYREAAGVLQASENSIGPWLRRAQERLREVLAPEATS